MTTHHIPEIMKRYIRFAPKKLFAHFGSLTFSGYLVIIEKTIEEIMKNKCMNHVILIGLITCGRVCSD